jgi:murein DD-endopeptidase MepM/ murein hydrolase activator NlpD
MPKASVIIFLLLFITIVLMVFWYYNNGLYYNPDDFQDGLLLKYFNAQHRYEIPWYYLSAYFKLKGLNNPSDTEIEYAAQKLHKAIDRGQGWGEFVVWYNMNRIGIEICKHKAINDILENKVFPIDTKENYIYDNDWHYPRTFGGDRRHEGIDIFCHKGVAVRSVSDGRITRLGWNTLGGWRVGIMDERNIYFYYAHLCRYEDGIFQGMTVKKGQIIGYVGDSGYGAEGTTGKFEPHLHFGIYQNDKAFNPYPFLRMWEQILN